MHENYQTSHPGGETGASSAEAAEPPVDAREKDSYRATAMAYAGDGHESAARELREKARQKRDQGQSKEAAKAQQEAEEQFKEADLAEQYAAKEYDAREKSEKRLASLRAVAQSLDEQSGDAHAKVSNMFGAYLRDAEYNLLQLGQVEYPPAVNYDYWASYNDWADDFRASHDDWADDFRASYSDWADNSRTRRIEYLAGKNPLDLALDELRRIGAIDQ